ncbi:two-component response regulator 24 [Cajanus cajan]|uniref:Two-component response regulator ARR22 n=1 Tax=Cajanus cajan TaxID=3821 RepID=A0A151T5S3_CAJCA|nr:two-component response regulator 24 [Cajanus cajan]KYP62399.1 Two-component response regulator ARR22 [Cajanus cajan]
MEGQSSNKRKAIAEPEWDYEFSALVVEEDADVRMAHKEILTLVGARTCDTVGNGQEAVNLHLNGKTFDLILMDFDMPGGDGFVTTNKLRSMGVHSLILSVSGPCSQDTVQRFLKEIPIDGHYIKPLTVQMLQEALQKLNLKP